MRARLLLLLHLLHLQLLQVLHGHGWRRHHHRRSVRHEGRRRRRLHLDRGRMRSLQLDLLTPIDLRRDVRLPLPGSRRAVFGKVRAIALGTCVPAPMVALERGAVPGAVATIATPAASTLLERASRCLT